MTMSHDHSRDFEAECAAQEPCPCIGAAVTSIEAVTAERDEALVALRGLFDVVRGGVLPGADRMDVVAGILAKHGGGGS